MTTPTPPAQDGEREWNHQEQRWNYLIAQYRADPFHSEIVKRIDDQSTELAALRAQVEEAEKLRSLVTKQFVRLLDYIDELDARQSNSNANAMWIDARAYYGLKCEAITTRANAFEIVLDAALAPPQPVAKEK